MSALYRQSAVSFCSPLCIWNQSAIPEASRTALKLKAFEFIDCNLLSRFACYDIYADRYRNCFVHASSTCLPTISHPHFARKFIRFRMSTPSFRKEIQLNQQYLTLRNKKLFVSIT